MNRATYFARGYENAQASFTGAPNPHKVPGVGGGWQRQAYDEGVQKANDERAAPKSELVRLFRISAGFGVSKRERDAAKRTAAHAVKFERQQRLRDFDRAINRLTAGRGNYRAGQNAPEKMPNVRRGPAWDRY